MAREAKMPGTEVGLPHETRGSGPEPGHLPVSELLADRAAAPSPFGDDQTFPLPVEELTYTRSTTP